VGPDLFNLSATDVVLPLVPMFHANAWGLVFSAPAVGAKLVMPGPMLDGASVYALLESERVTFSAGVPAVWHNLLQHLAATGAKLHSLRRVVIGGAALPESILRSFWDEHGVSVSHAWGMTETSPLATHSTPTSKVAAMEPEARVRFALKQGRAPLTVELKLAGFEGGSVPWDGEHSARLKGRGPFVAAGYFGSENEVLDEEGFLDTGDVATIDAHGFVKITDRAKDIIKSGGEWISSCEIENITLGHPKVAMAAVIGIAHPKWDERPLLVVELRSGMTATEEELRCFLSGKVPTWWVPDAIVFVEEMPLGATGKVDKRKLRDRFSAGSKAAV